MPGNEEAAAAAKNEGVEITNAEYNHYVQTLYYSQAQSRLIAQALNDDNTLPAPVARPGEKSLTRFRHRLNIKRKTFNVKRKTYS